MTAVKETTVDTSGFSTSSSPSDLRITDMRIAVVGHSNWRWPIIKLFTNQGLVGLGEVRDGASARYALMLKSRLLGENPCDVAACRYDPAVRQLLLLPDALLDLRDDGLKFGIPIQSWKVFPELSLWVVEHPTSL